MELHEWGKADENVWCYCSWPKGRVSKWELRKPMISSLVTLNQHKWWLGSQAPGKETKREHMARSHRSNVLLPTSVKGGKAPNICGVLNDPRLAHHATGERASQQRDPVSVHARFRVFRPWGTLKPSERGTWEYRWAEIAFGSAPWILVGKTELETKCNFKSSH